MIFSGDGMHGKGQEKSVKAKITAGAKVLHRDYMTVWKATN